MQELLNRYMQIAPRTRYLSLAGAWFAAFLVYYFTSHLSHTSEIESLYLQMRVADAERVEKAAYAANLPRFEARVTELSQNLQSAAALLPEDAQSAKLLAQIGNLAKDLGVIIDNFHPQIEQAKDFYAVNQFGLDLRGSYHEIAMLIDQVSRLDRIVNVSDLSMKQPKFENQKVTLQASIVLETYHFLSEEQVAQDKAKKGGRPS